jgi:hypothetical protein
MFGSTEWKLINDVRRVDRKVCLLRKKLQSPIYNQLTSMVSHEWHIPLGRDIFCHWLTVLHVMLGILARLPIAATETLSIR